MWAVAACLRAHARHDDAVVGLPGQELLEPVGRALGGQAALELLVTDHTRALNELAAALAHHCLTI